MYAYNNAMSILLGKVLEKVGGNSLDKLAYEIFFQPLQMTHSSFTPLFLPNAVIAPSEVDAWRGREVRGEVHDESAYT